MDCVPGFFQNVIGGVKCPACGPGRFSSNSGASSCFNCPSDTYSPSNATTCTDCDQGFVSPPGSAFCNPASSSSSSGGAGASCTIGRYSFNSNCVNCAPGRFSDVADATTCLACNAGSYQNLAAQSQCLLCRAGSFQANPGANNCPACALGRYSDVAGAMSCTPCSLDTYAPATNSTTCISCDQGFVAPTGASSCTPASSSSSGGSQSCAPGTFTGASSCVNCVPGRFSDISNAANCALCLSGSFQNNARQTACLLCRAGSFQSVDGSINCNFCPIGRFSSVLGAANCLECPLDTFTAVTNSTSCLNCAQGFVAPPGSASCTPSSSSSSGTSGPTCNLGQFLNASTCFNCLQGRFSNVQNAPNCVPCAQGSFQNFVAQSACIACRAGSFQANPGAINCPACPGGRFSFQTGASTCFNCPANTFSSANSTFCRDCQQGFVSAPASTSCTPASSTSSGAAGPSSSSSSSGASGPCQPGAYLDNTSCSPCPLGSYSNIQGADFCIPCSVGQVNPNVGRSTCIECRAGFIQPNIGGIACFACTVGRFQNLPGSTSCLDCPQNTFNAVFNATVCRNCDQGFVSAPGSAFCTPAASASSSSGSAVNCPIGTFVSQSGECVSCPLGRFSSVVNAQLCPACDPGTFQSQPAKSSCALCQPGSFQPNAGFVQCFPCPVNTFSGNMGSAMCMNCTSGLVAPSGSSFCVAPSVVSCPAGNYFASPACAPCPLGTANPLSGNATFCRTCIPGRYSDMQGAMNCAPCDAGTYTNIEGQTTCAQCPPGTNSPVGAVSCADNLVNCGPGTFRDATNRCFPCSFGSFSDHFGATSCNLCPLGRVAPAMNMTSCVSCGLGSFANLAGSTSCALCPLNFVANRTGQAFCNPCPPPSFTTQVGSISCIVPPPASSSSGSASGCNPGTFFDGSVCRPCNPGFFSAQANQQACSACPLGFVQSQSGRTSCLACQPGSFSNLFAQVACLVCPVGNAQPQPGASECFRCFAGSFVNTTGSTFCSPCPAPLVSPAGASSCSLPPNPCNSAPCAAGSTCQALSSTSYQCLCPFGFSGSDCSQIVNYCSSSPCGSFGQCAGTAGGFTCSCAPGYTGTLCSENINECVFSPCGNGQCIDGIASYTCVCNPGWAGPACQNNINECASAPCLNGGSCSDLINDFRCVCTSSFTGRRCESPVSVCAGVLCQNGGSCNGLGNCSCPAGFSGARCEFSGPTRISPLSVTLVTSTSIRLGWGQPLIAGLTYEIAQVTAASTSTQAVFSVILTVPTLGNRTATIFGLTRATPCSFAVRGRSDIGAGPWSDIVTAVTAPLPPSAPVNVDAAPLSSSSVIVSWEAPSDDGGAAIVSYSVVVSLDGRNTVLVTPFNPVTVSGLNNGTTYSVAVRANNARGSGQTSASVSVSTLSASPAVTRIVASDPGNGDAIFSEGDFIDVFFNIPTNQPALAPAELFSFSSSIGDATGSWVNPTLYRIVIGSDAPIVNPVPQAGVFYLTVLLSADVRSFNGQSTPSSSISPPLFGNFGTSIIADILSLPVSVSVPEGQRVDLGVQLLPAAFPSTFMNFSCTAQRNDMVVPVFMMGAVGFNAFALALPIVFQAPSFLPLTSPPARVAVRCQFTAGLEVVDSGVVVVTILPVNDLPTIQAPPALVIAPGNPAALQISIADVDITPNNNPAVLVRLSTLNGVGSFKISTFVNTVTITPPWGEGETLDFFGPITGINAALASLTFSYASSSFTKIIAFVNDYGNGVEFPQPTDYRTNIAFVDVIVNCAQAAPPALVSATVSPRGDFIDISLSTSVFFSGRVNCSALFTASTLADLGVNPTCIFVNRDMQGDAIRVFIGLNANPVALASSFLVRALALRRCPSAALASPAVNTNLPLTFSPTSIVPVVAVFGPNVYSGCGDLVLASSVQDAGLLMSASWTLPQSIDSQETTVDNTGRLIVRPTAFPVVTQPTSYVFSFVVTNFAGATASSSLEVRLTPDSTLPTVFFDNLAVMTESANPLELAARVARSTCANAPVPVLAWTVTPALPITFPASSALRIAPGTLLPGTVYIFVLSATVPAGTVSGSVTVFVQSVPVVARLRSNSIVVTESNNFTLDATLSQIPAGVAPVFTWSCVNNQDNSPCVRKDDRSPLIGSALRLFTLMPFTLEGGFYTITVSITVGSASSSTSASVRILPVVVVNPEEPGTNPAPQITGLRILAPPAISTSSSLRLFALIEGVPAEATVITWQLLAPTTSTILTGVALNVPVLDINPERRCAFFEADVAYRFRVSVTYSGVSVEADAVINVRSAPFGGSFTLDKQQIVGFNETIRMSASQWSLTALSDSESSFLNFQFFYEQQGVLIAISPRTSSNTVATTLPGGSTRSDLPVVLRVFAINGACVDIRRMVAILPVSAAQVVSSFTQVANEARQNGDAYQLLTLVNTVSSSVTTSSAGASASTQARSDALDFVAQVSSQVAPSNAIASIATIISDSSAITPDLATRAMNQTQALLAAFRQSLQADSQSTTGSLTSSEANILDLVTQILAICNNALKSLSGGAGSSIGAFTANSDAQVQVINDAYSTVSQALDTLAATELELPGQTYSFQYDIFSSEIARFSASSGVLVSFISEGGNSVSVSAASNSVSVPSGVSDVRVTVADSNPFAAYVNSAAGEAALISPAITVAFVDSVDFTVTASGSFSVSFPYTAASCGVNCVPTCGVYSPAQNMFVPAGGQTSVSNGVMTCTSSSAGTYAALAAAPAPAPASSSSTGSNNNNNGGVIPEPESEKTDNTMIIAIGAGAGAFVVIIAVSVLAYCYCYRKLEGGNDKRGSVDNSSGGVVLAMVSAPSVPIVNSASHSRAASMGI